MGKYDTVKEKVAAIYCNHLENKFGGHLEFDEIRVVPRLDQWDEEYLQIYVVFDGDGDLLDPNWLNGLYWEIRPELIELRVAGVPPQSYAVVRHRQNSFRRFP